MKNEKIFTLVMDSCTASVPDVMLNLTFDAAEKYKDTVTPVKPSRVYVKAVAVYAVACLVLLIVIPFIISNVGNEPMVPGDNPLPTKTETSVPKDDPKKSSIDAKDINEVYNKVDPDTLSTKVTIEEVENIIEAARLAYDDYDVIVLSNGTELETTPKKPDITVPELETWAMNDQTFVDYNKYFDNLYMVVIDALTLRFPEQSVYVVSGNYANTKSDIYARCYLGFCVLDIDGSGYINAEKIYDEMMGAGPTVSKYYCDMIWFSKGFEGDTNTIMYEYQTDTNDRISGEKTMIFPTPEEYEILTAELPPEVYSEYRLAIEDEILTATGRRTNEELIGHGYEEITPAGDKFLVCEFDCEMGDADFRVYTGLESDEAPFIEAFDYPYPELEKGKLRVIIDIRVVDLLIKIRVTVDEGDPIVLPETVEKELRYILNIEKDDPITDLLAEGIRADDIRYLDSDVGYKFAVIERDGKFGLINTDGEIILPIEYSSIDLNYLAPDDLRMKLLAIVSSETEYKTYWIEADGTPVEEFVGGWGVEGGVGIYWMNGKPLMLDSFNGEIEYFVDRYTSDIGYKKTYTVASGKQSDIIPIQEISGYSYIESMLFYHVEDDQKISHKYALFNFRTKELITDFIFDDCSNEKFVEGILPVKKNGKWGYVNEFGEMITDFIYDASETKEYYGNIIETMYYTHSGYTIVRQGDLFGLMDKSGDLVLDIMYEDISNVNPDGYVWVKTNGRWNVMNIS